MAVMPVRWDIEPSRSRLGFKVRHLLVSTARGEFKRFSGFALIDESQLATSTVEVEIETASVDTGQQDRDDNLRSEIFHSAREPKMTFRSTSVRERGRGRLELAGELTIVGRTKPVTLEVEGLSLTGTHCRVRAKGTLSRRDWSLGWSAAIEAGGIAVADKVELELEVELVRR